MDEINVGLNLDQWQVVLMGLDWVHHANLRGDMGDPTLESMAVDNIMGMINGKCNDYLRDHGNHRDQENWEDQVGYDALDILAREEQ